MSRTQLSLAAAAVAVVLVWFSCGRETDEKPKTTSNPPPAQPAPQPAPGPSPSPSGPALTLSPQYKSLCAGCHGSNGEGPTTLKHTKLTLTQYQTTVRYGWATKTMPGFDASKIDDTAIRLDYQVLTSP